MANSESNVDRILKRLRFMAAEFAFKPDQRINESALALQLNASRTPVREALNRLVAEGFLTFQSGRGFFCRSLSPKRILDLYEARLAVECEALRLACLRASDAEISELTDYLDEIEPRYKAETDTLNLLSMDESFHVRLAELSQNAELVRMLGNLNDRVRYVRMIDLRRMQDEAENRGPAISPHRHILNALSLRDVIAADNAMRNHLERRRDEATEAVKIAYAQLYVPQD